MEFNPLRQCFPKCPFQESGRSATLKKKRLGFYNNLSKFCLKIYMTERSRAIETETSPKGGQGNTYLLGAG